MTLLHLTELLGLTFDIITLFKDKHNLVLRISHT